MIFRFNSSTVKDLRDYYPEDESADINPGDIVIFCLTIIDLFNSKNAAMFRLVAGYSTSGKVDDAQNILASSTIADHYWEKVTKNYMRSEMAPPQLIPTGGSYTLTHSEDVDFKRMYSMVEVTPVNIILNITPESTSIEAWLPVDDTITYPIYTGDPVSGVTLNKRLRMRKVQEINVGADILANESREILEIYSLYSIDDNFYVAHTTKHETFQSFAVYDSTTFQYLYNIDNPNNAIPRDIVGDYSVSREEMIVEIHKVTNGLYNWHQDLGGWTNYVPKYTTVLLNDHITMCAHYHDIEGYWSIYEPNAREFRIHSLSGGQFDDGVVVNYIGNVQRYAFELYTFKGTQTVFYRVKYGNILEGFHLVAVDGHYEEIRSIWEDSANIGEWLFYTENIGYFLDSPQIGDCWKVNFTSMSDGTHYSGYEASKLYNVKGFIPTERPKTMLLDDFYGGDYWIYSSYYSYESSMRTVDPNTGYVVHIGDLRDLLWDDDFYQSKMFSSNACRGLGNNRYVILPLDGLGTNPTVFELEPNTAEMYKSAGIQMMQVVLDAVTINNVTINGTLPPLTDMRVLISDSGDPSTKYKWASTAWVVETDAAAGNTMAEFNAADASLLITEVGSTLDIWVYLISMDSTATPVFTSVDVDYFKGEDSRRMMDPLYPSVTTYSIEALSSTQTRFNNNSGLSKYIKAGVHFIE